jgi:DNA-binding transcriptional regulator YhcF (GntR family)
MSEKLTYGQREYMRKMIEKHGLNPAAVCTAYEQAERDGVVFREKNSSRKTAKEYAIALWNDGERKGWF